MNVAYGLAIFFVFGALCVFFTSPVMGVIMILFVCWMCYEGNKQYNKEIERYNLAKTNFEKYQQQIVREQEYAIAIEKMKPKCPMCGSTNMEDFIMSKKKYDVHETVPVVVHITVEAENGEKAMEMSLCFLTVKEAVYFLMIGGKLYEYTTYKKIAKRMSLVS